MHNGQESIAAAAYACVTRNPSTLAFANIPDAQSHSYRRTLNRTLNAKYTPVLCYMK